MAFGVVLAAFAAMACLADAQVAPANNAAVVLWGAARFSFLTDRVVRMQVMQPKSNITQYDDRPSFTVVNRDLPVPQLNVQVLEDGKTIRVATSNITLSYTSPTGNTSALSKSSCTQTWNADIVDGNRVPAYPFGANVTNVTGCCALCDADPDCTLFIYATDGPQAPNCWLMQQVTATTPSGSRIVGGWLSSLNVSVTFNMGPSASPPGAQGSWSFGMQDTGGNNNGTSLWLDCYDSPEGCAADGVQGLESTRGLTSRFGWFVYDDASSARFVDPSQPSNPLLPPPTPHWYANSSHDLLDVYGYFHGLDYAGALQDYISIAGRAPLMPYSALGVWWSKWHAYTQSEFTGDVLANYSSHDLPLSHVVLDVDWHTQNNGDPAGSCYSYGGFSPNRALWTDWEGFIASLTNGSNPTGRPLKLLLNIHPQGGLDHCQVNWPYFAQLMGVNTSNTSYIVPCDYGNQTFASAVFAAFVDNSTETGGPGVADVSHWWTDTNGCTGPSGAPLGGNTGMAWHNYVYYSHQAQLQPRRALVLSRWGGLGNHRYPVGFSGDAFQDPAILQFQLRFTPTAANVLASWSHDIGGFHAVNAPGDGFPGNSTGGEVYLRWIQAAITWPIFRTHCTTWGDQYGRQCERRIWMFTQYYPWMADAFRTRNALQPYLYSEYRVGYDAGMLPVHPMYYHWPALDDAYAWQYQYMFGRQILSAPISAVRDNSTGLAFKQVWLPPGTWVHWNGTQAWTGPGMLPQSQWAVWEVPLFVQAGTILPMKTMASVSDVSPDPLAWVAWPTPSSTGAPAGRVQAGGKQGREKAVTDVTVAGKDKDVPAVAGAVPGSYTVYEDDGDSVDYETAPAGAPDASVSAIQTATFTESGNVYTVQLGAWQGSYTGFSPSRGYEVHYRGLCPGSTLPASVTVNGIPVPQGASPNQIPGWYVAQASNGTLALPGGTLVVAPGRFLAQESVTVVVAM